MRLVESLSKQKAEAKAESPPLTLEQRIEELENELERLKDTLKVKLSDLEYSLRYGELRKSILEEAASYTDIRSMREWR